MNYLNSTLSTLNQSTFQKWQFIGIDEKSLVSKYLYKRLDSKEISVYVNWLRSIWFFYCANKKSILFGTCPESHLHPKSTLQHIEIALGNYWTHQRFA